MKPNLKNSKPTARHNSSNKKVYIWMGCALCLFGAVMWPCIPLVVDASMVGTAFGVTTAIQNLGLATAPTAFTALQQSSGNFMSTFIVIIVCNVVALTATIAVWRLDTKKNDGRLMKP